MQKRKIVFFDRDGVVNLEDSPYGYKIEEFYFAPYFMELFLKLKEQNSLCFLITNQSGINRKIFTQEDFYHLNAYMQNCITSCLMMPLRKKGFIPQNIAFDRIYFCPHTTDEMCECRKPKSGMLLQALRDFNLSLKDYQTYIIGDKDTEMIAGLNVGIERRIHIGDDYSPNATHHIHSLKEALSLFEET